MKALFVTSSTSDVDSLVRAWDCWNAVPAEWVKFNHKSIRNDAAILNRAREVSPDIIFYVGANRGSGIPSIPTLKRLRGVAPSVNLCCDAADPPWHGALKRYADCFDLQVALDGVRSAPVDLVTVTPVDPRPYAGEERPRPYLCGFSGGVPTWFLNADKDFPFHTRPKVRTIARRSGALPGWTPMIPLRPAQGVPGMQTRDGLFTALRAASINIAFRKRTLETSYAEHVDFLRSCRIVLNTSLTGSEQAHHIKGRVLEAGWAGCALFEPVESPIASWFPRGSWFGYRDAADIGRLLETLSLGEIGRAADMLSRHVRENYHPATIYKEILKHVDATKPVPAA